LDAAGIGAVVALKEAKLPVYDEENDKVDYEAESKEKLPLSDQVTFPVTVHKIGDKFLVDPTREEEDVSETRVTIGMNKETISSMQKGETQVIGVEEFNEVLDLSKKSWNEVFKKIEKSIK